MLIHKRNRCFTFRITTNHFKARMELTKGSNSQSTKIKKQYKWVIWCLTNNWWWTLTNNKCFLTSNIRTINNFSQMDFIKWINFIKVWSTKPSHNSSNCSKKITMGWFNSSTKSQSTISYTSRLWLLLQMLALFNHNSKKPKIWQSQKKMTSNGQVFESIKLRY